MTLHPITVDGWMAAVEDALARLPHELHLRDMGDEVVHDQHECARCRAAYSLRELVNWGVNTDPGHSGLVRVFAAALDEEAGRVIGALSELSEDDLYRVVGAAQMVDKEGQDHGDAWHGWASGPGADE